MDEAARRVNLRKEGTKGGSRHLEAYLTGEGDLRIDGQDLGVGVSSFWGSGLTEYEWVITVRREHVAAAVEALGGQPGEDILDLLATRFVGERAIAIKPTLEARGVPVEFWSRVGD